MSYNFYRLSLDSYTAFLAVSKFLPTKLAAAYVEFKGNSLNEYLNQAEENGLASGGKLTKEVTDIASIICMPEKTIVASNSSFGRIPMCFFCYKNGFWAFVSMDYSNKYVTLLAPIEKQNIALIAKDALIGNLEISVKRLNDDAGLPHIFIQMYQESPFYTGYLKGKSIHLAVDSLQDLIDELSDLGEECEKNNITTE